MARQTKGRIFKSGKKGIFHLQYYVNGRQFVVTLRDEAGNPITNERNVQKAVDAILNPVRAKDTAVRLRQVRDAVETAEAKIARLEEEQRIKQKAAEDAKRDAKATIKDGWTLFLQCKKRPASCKRYADEDIPRTSTAANYRAYCKKFAEWMKEHHAAVKTLPEVTEDHAAAFMDHVRKESASGTFNKYLQFFNCFFKVLNEEKKIQCENPFRDIDRMEISYHSKNELSRDQVSKLIDTASGEMRLLLAMGYFTGLRFGDCCTLLWQEISMSRRIIERVPRKTEHRAKDIKEATVKIGISPLLYEMLSEVAESDRQGYVLPSFATDYLNDKEYVASKKIMAHFARCGIRTVRPGTGTPEKRNEKGKVIKKAVRAVVDYGFHSLRYSYISHNAEAGTPASIIQKNAGHANPGMTEHYTRISDRAAVEYAKALSLPIIGTGDVIDVVPTDPERVQLHQLADTLDLETIKRMLELAEVKR